MDDVQPVVKDDDFAQVNFGDIPADIQNRGGNNPNGTFIIMIE